MVAALKKRDFSELNGDGSAMDKYYVRIVGRAFGPLDYERVCEMLDKGRIASGTDVSTDSLNWRRADSFPEFEKYFAGGGGSYSVLPSSGSETAQWYVRTLDGREYGPMKRAQILEALRAGRLSLSTLAWRLGDQEREIHQIPDFKEATSTRVLPSASAAPNDLLFGEPSQADDLVLVEDEPESSADPFAEIPQAPGKPAESAAPTSADPVEAVPHDASDPFEAALHAKGGPPEEFLKTSKTSFDESSQKNASSSASGDDEDEFYLEELTSFRKRNRRLQIWHRSLLVCFIALLATQLLLFALDRVVILDSISDSPLGVRLIKVVSPILDWGGVGAYVFYVVSLVCFVYNFWASIPSQYRQMSALSASAPLLVPILNLGWSFVAFCQGAQRVDAALSEYIQNGRSRGESIKYAGFEQSAVCAVYFDVSFVLAAFLRAVPIEGLYCFVVLAPLVLYLFSFRMKNAAVQLNAWRESDDSSDDE